MARGPCCEKMGLKKGPWSPEEDDILINYIHLYGHSNWRALPRQAGLLRCGKSCRLRWINYLRPDIKRGNFTKEEEDTIINLHHMLGNRWSAIAARLPGRTDNEIKNVWHTHLKKRVLAQYNYNTPSTHDNKRQDTPKKRQMAVTLQLPDDSNGYRALSECSLISDVSSSSVTTTTARFDKMDNNYYALSSEEVIDDTFWSEVLSADSSDSVPAVEFDGAAGLAEAAATASSPLGSAETVSDSNTSGGDMDFWYNLFTLAGHMLDLPQF